MILLHITALKTQLDKLNENVKCKISLHPTQVRRTLTALRSSPNLVKLGPKYVILRHLAKRGHVVEGIPGTHIRS